MPTKTTGTREDACHALFQAGETLASDAFTDTPDAEIDAMVARVLEAYALHVRTRSAVA